MTLGFCSVVCAARKARFPLLLTSDGFFVGTVNKQMTDHVASLGKTCNKLIEKRQAALFIMSIEWLSRT